MGLHMGRSNSKGSNHVVCMEMYRYLIFYDADSEADVTRYIVMATLDSSYVVGTSYSQIFTKHIGKSPVPRRHPSCRPALYQVDFQECYI